MSTCGLANKNNPSGVDVVSGGVFLEPEDRRFHIICIRGKWELWGQSIVDAEPGETSTRQRLEDISNVLPFVPSYPPTTVHKDCGGEWAIPIRNVRI